MFVASLDHLVSGGITSPSSAEGFDTVEVRSSSLLVPTIIFNEIHGSGAFLYTRDAPVIGFLLELFGSKSP